MQEISAIGKEMLAFQKKLGETKKYKPIPIDLFDGNIRDKYISTLPNWCQIDGEAEKKLYSSDNTLICEGYNRIVIGDYGAFVEIETVQINLAQIICEKGQEYRICDPAYTEHVKYHWLTTKDNSHCKIYFQQKKVEYADYIPGMYYISPFEIFTKKENMTRNEIKEKYENINTEELSQEAVTYAFSEGSRQRFQNSEKAR